MKLYHNKGNDIYYKEGEPLTYKPSNSSLFMGIPTTEQLLNWGFVEVQEQQSQGQPISYEELVVQKIRDRYSVDDEFALLRQRDVKPNEFAIYNSYCEECKQMAREVLGMDE